MSENKTGFVSYLDDDGKIISGYSEILEINQTFIKIKTNQNIIIIPMQRVLKIKMKEVAGE